MKINNNIHVTDELISKYLAGEADPEEADALTGWLQQQGCRDYFEQLETAWNKSRRETKPSFDKATAWNNLQISKGAIPERNAQSKMSTLSPVRIMGIAASILLVMASIVWVMRGTETKVHNKTAITTGETETISLPDNTTVTLFRNTAIDFPDHFNKHMRNVTLHRGEAFFRVSPDERKPFLIHTPAAEIRVVGTEFNVLVNNGNTEVSVKEGEVKLYTDRDTVHLRKGSLGKVTAGQRAIDLGKITDGNVWSYATRRLVFQDSPLQQVILDLEKSYQCTILLRDKKIEKCNFTATFDGDDIDKIVNLIAEILNLTVRKNGQTFILEGEGCP